MLSNAYISFEKYISKNKCDAKQLLEMLQYFQLYTILQILRHPQRRPYTTETDISVCVFYLVRAQWWWSGTKISQRSAKKANSPPPDSWISNLVPQYCANTSSMTVYGHILLKIISAAGFYRPYRQSTHLNGAYIEEVPRSDWDLDYLLTGFR